MAQLLLWKRDGKEEELRVEAKNQLASVLSGQEWGGEWAGPIP